MKNKKERFKKDESDTVSANVDVDTARFPDKVSSAEQISSSKTTTPASSYAPTKMKSKGGELKQEVASEIIKTREMATSSGVDASSASSASVSDYSGNSGVIMGSTGATPILDTNAQGNTRVEKRISDANKQINYLVSEQVLTSYDELEPLAKSNDDVGYNGNNKNIYARMQKRTGNHPGDPLYDRSVDEIRHDSLLFSCGQVVQTATTATEAYPTKTEVYGTYTVDTAYNENGEATSTTTAYGWHEVDSTTTALDYALPTRGNFMEDYLEVHLYHWAYGPYANTVTLGRFMPYTIDLSCNDEIAEVVNASSANHYIDINRAELARQDIDQNAGSPTDEWFNPLGRSISQPSRYVTYLQDLENATGAEVAMAVRFAMKAKGYYLNRTAKDGLDLTDPLTDALYGGLFPATDMSDFTTATSSGGAGITSGNAGWFADSLMGHGAASLMVAVQDSTAKYTTKADIVTQAKGLKQPLQTGLNYYKTFHCKKEFLDVLNSIDTFSTIDREYDPNSTVEIEDNIKLVHPYNWESTLRFGTNTSGDTAKVYESTVPTYSYFAGSGSNKFYIRCADPLMNGIAWYFSQNARRWYTETTGYSQHTDYATLSEGVTAAGYVDGITILQIPMVHSTTHFSLWDYIICASLPYILYERTNTMKDILDYEKHFKYPFENVSLAEYDPLKPTNYDMPSMYEPLKVKQMKPATALRWTMPEMYIPIAAGSTGNTPEAKGNVVWTIAPWYFSEREYTPWAVGALNDTTKWTVPTLEAETDSRNFNFPVIRSGVRSSYLDDFYGMSPKEVYLSYDAMTRLPHPGNNSDYDWDAYAPGVIYKYSQQADGIPVIANGSIEWANSDSAESGNFSDEDYLPRVLDYYSTPRALGWVIPCMVGTCDPSPVPITWGDNFTPATYSSGWWYSAENATDNYIATSAPAFRCRLWRAVRQGTGATDEQTMVVLGAGGVNVNRAQAFEQDWYERWTNVNQGYVNNTEFNVRLSLNEVNDVSVQTPFTNRSYYAVDGTSSNIYTNISTQTLASIFWARIQKLPFILNPFDLSTWITRYNLIVDAADDPASTATNGNGYVAITDSFGIDPFDIGYMFGLAGFYAADYNEYVYNRLDERLNMAVGYTSDLFMRDSPLLKS